MDKTLLISGSPRKGNTEFLLSSIFEKLGGEKELVLLRDKKIQHCLGCLACHNTPDCVIKDDMSEILSKVLVAQTIIIGTPNYFGNVSGLLKDFIDRLHPFYKAESLKGKKLILIMVGGGSTESSKKYLADTLGGFVKYLKFDLIGSYCFQALQAKELENDPNLEPAIEEIVEKIEPST